MTFQLTPHLRVCQLRPLNLLILLQVKDRAEMLVQTKVLSLVRMLHLLKMTARLVCKQEILSVYQQVVRKRKKDSLMLMRIKQF